jgi:hypothetical protein
VDDDVLHMRLAFADVVYEAAGQLVGLGERHLRRYGHRHEHDEAAGGVQQQQLPWGLARAVDHEPCDALALRLVRRGAAVVGTSGDRLLQRLQVGVNVVYAGLVAQGRLHPLGDIVGLPDGVVRGHLEVQGDADATVVLVDGDVVGFAHQRLGERDREHPVAEVQAVASRFEMDDHVAVG